MKKIYLLLIILLIIEFLLASICAPASCEWGNDTYFYGGIIILLAAFVLPFFEKTWPVSKRIGIGFLFALAALAVWVIGFLVCNFNIMCRMF